MQFFTRRSVEGRGIPLSGWRRRVLEIPEPCPEPWDEMTGDDRRRRCARCACDVHDLSVLSRSEAAELVSREPPCVQVRFARPGWLRFRDGVVATVLAAGLAGCLRGKLPPPPPEAVRVDPAVSDPRPER